MLSYLLLWVFRFPIVAYYRDSLSSDLHSLSKEEHTSVFLLFLDSRLTGLEEGKLY